jgi:hypothetical protein
MQANHRHRPHDGADHDSVRWDGLAVEDAGGDRGGNAYGEAGARHRVQQRGEQLDASVVDLVSGMTGLSKP